MEAVALSRSKTTIVMEILRIKSPQMELKEVMMHMIGYNAVRLLMLKAAAIP
ncbi:MAG: putative transcriptional regulator [Verrucomicrobiales bacterium]|jgi:predicted transcriptional regulator